MENFSSEAKRRPRFLSCHHTFCTECLDDLAAQKSQRCIICPNCRSESSLGDGGVQGLKVNFTIEELIPELLPKVKAVEEGGGKAKAGEGVVVDGS